MTKLLNAILTANPLTRGLIGFAIGAILGLVVGVVLFS